MASRTGWHRAPDWRARVHIPATLRRTVPPIPPGIKVIFYTAHPKMASEISSSSLSAGVMCSPAFFQPPARRRPPATAGQVCAFVCISIRCRARPPQRGSSCGHKADLMSQFCSRLIVPKSNKSTRTGFFGGGGTAAAAVAGTVWRCAVLD